MVAERAEQASHSELMCVRVEWRRARCAERGAANTTSTSPAAAATDAGGHGAARGCTALRQGEAHGVGGQAPIILLLLHVQSEAYIKYSFASLHSSIKFFAFCLFVTVEGFTAPFIFI